MAGSTMFYFFSRSCKAKQNFTYYTWNKRSVKITYLSLFTHLAPVFTLILQTLPVEENSKMTNTTSTANQQRNVENAGKAKNPMESVPNAFQFTAKNGAEYKLYCRTKADMDAKTLKWAFKLAERNVSPYYKTLKIGWQPKVKQNDLNKKWARYLVATDKSGQPVAYTMFRFDMDYGNSVLYCYEMQIEPESQRQGLGKFMMNILEQCAQHWHMDKVVLTVLKNNTNATAFFKTIGYSLDETSPDILEKAEYEILSKILL